MQILINADLAAFAEQVWEQESIEFACINGGDGPNSVAESGECEYRFNSVDDAARAREAMIKAVIAEMAP